MSNTLTTEWEIEVCEFADPPNAECAFRARVNRVGQDPHPGAASWGPTYETVAWDALEQIHRIERREQIAKQLEDSAINRETIRIPLRGSDQ